RSKGRELPRTRSEISLEASRSSAAYRPPTAPVTAVPFDRLPLAAAMPPGARLGRGGQLGEGRLDAGRERLDEAGMVEVRADLVDPGGALADRDDRAVDV